MTRRTRIKICGITRTADAVAAATLGADAIGMVFWSRSPRAVDLDRGCAIALAVPAFVTRVALFVDPSAAEVERVLAAVPVDLLQFHGDEDAAFCAKFGRPYLKALRVSEDARRSDLLEYAARFPDAQGLLLDTMKPGAMPGGTGQTFDWSRVPRNLGRPLLLSGGLHQGNVGEAIRALRPWAVDVSTGVEMLGDDGQPRRGVKDPARISGFIRGVRDADA